MNRHFKFLSVLAVFALLAAAYKVKTTKASVPLDYQIVLQKSLNDRSVVSFLARYDCAPTGDFQLCRASGLALQTDSHGLIRQVVLYVDGNDEFAPFAGELPYGITFADTMADVQQKMGNPKVAQMPTLGWEPGLPDSGGTPDHLHYWATYEQYDMTIVYNTPSANDLSASIYMIILHIGPILPPRGYTISV